MGAILVEGDLLDFDAQCIAHQCNCVSKGVAGLAKFLFEKYPKADIYVERNNNYTFHKPGEIYVRDDYRIDNSGTSWKNIYIINMTSQFLPGPPGSSFEIAPGMTVTETSETREKLFVQCLKEIKIIVEENKIESIAFPYRVGCGLAGGNWDRYKFVLDKFADQMYELGCKVYIVKRTEDD